jgi:beta-lactamase regulating signal transducer with metallopeptidase domain
MNDVISSWLGQETGHHMSFEVASICWGLTLLHFLWQGAIIGLLGFVAARLLRNQSASVRYWLNAAALLACPMCVAWTFAVVEVPESWRVSSNQLSLGSFDSDAVPIETFSANNLADVPYPKLDPPQAITNTDAAPVPLDASAENQTSAPVAIETKTSFASEWMPVVARWIAILYAVGVVCFFVRLAIALWGGHRLRAISTPVSDSALLELIRTQAHRIGLKLVPVVAYCERVAVPTVIGVLRPMILLPATLTTGLTTDELSAILSHELAHIRRYDLWMNLLQRIIESLLFFHPVVWFLSRRLSTEREICCDDLVIRSGHQPMNYAGALLRMAELCVLSRQPQLTSVSAGGVSSQELTYRIERLMHFRHQSKYRLTRAGLAICFALLVVSSGIPSLFSVLAQQTTPTISRSSASVATSQKGIESIQGTVIGELQGVAVTAIFRLEDDSKSPSAPFPKTTVVAEVKTITDAQGKYTVGVPRQYIGNKSLRVSIRLEHPGYLTRTMDFCYVEDFQNQEIRNDERWWLTRELTRSAVRSSLLRKGKPLLGQVLLPDGQPAAGAMVATSSKYRAYSWKFSDPNEYGSSATATTDANGHFELLIDEPATLQVSLVGHAPLVVDDLSKLNSGDIDNSSRQTFRLPLAIRPTGKVTTFKRSPVAGAIVEARRDFEWNEFDMPTAFGFACATNERGEFTMPPMPAGKYTFSVRSRLENVSDVPIFNRRANEESKTPVTSLLALTAPFADLQTVAMSDVVLDQDVELIPWNMSAQISLSAVETVTVTIHVDFPNGLPENDRTADLTVSGQFNGKQWAGQSQIAGADGKVQFVVPKGLHDSAVGTGHALQRQSSKEPWQPGEALHLGTLTTDLVGPEVLIPRLAKLRVKLVALPDDIAKNGGRLSIHAFYAREGYAGNRAALQRLFLAGQFQSGNDEYRALALPNEECVLRVTNGYAENAVVLFEEKLMLPSGDDQLLTIDVVRKVSTRETTQAAGSGNSQKESAFGSGRTERSLTSSVQAVPQATETGTLEGRISVEGPPPQRPQLRVPTPDSPLLLKRATDEQRKAWEASLVNIDDESLLVDAELGLANAFVYLAKRPSTFKSPQGSSEPVTIRMQDFRFSPRATVIQTSQDLVLDNSGRGPNGFRFDPFRNNGQNRLVDSGEKTTLEDPFTSPETIPVQARSETEIWKKTFLLPVDHPFAAVTDGRGRFSIQGLPPGEHQFRIWHERAGWLEKSLTVSVKAGETTPLEQSYNLDRFRLASNPINGAAAQGTAKPTAVGIRYPYCLLNTEGLAERSFLEAIASFNLTSQESPTGVRQPPITEQETRDAIAKFAAESHVPEGVRTQLEQILKSGELPENVYFRRFTRFDDGKQMQGVWWVRLVIETGNGPVYSVPVRSTSLFARPYTQMERQQNAADGLTLINRVASYYEEPPVVVQPSDLPAASVETSIRKTQDGIKAEDDTAIGSLFESTGASETQREFAVSELKALSKARVHSIKVSPLKLKGEQRTWSAWQFYKPNLPVVAFLEIEYEDKDAVTRRADAQPLAEERKVLSLELGMVGEELRLVNYVPDGERTPPESLNPGPSITGHLEPLADGTHIITDVITNPGTLLSAHLANEEIRQRDFRNASEQEE